MSRLPDKLFKTTIVIWSEYDPNSNEMEIDDLAREAMQGDAYCSSQKTECVDPRTDYDWDGTDFFGPENEDEDEESETEPVAGEKDS